MKKSFVILILGISFSTFAQTQSEISIDTLKLDRFHMEFNPVFSNQFQLQTPTLQNMNLTYKMSLNDIAHQMPKLNFPQSLNLYTPNINTTDNLYNQIKIDNQSWIITSRTSTNYYGLGGLSMASANYNLKINESIVLSAGLYGSKYNLYTNFYNNAGVNGNFKFRLSDRISVNLYGQYSGQPNTRLLPLMTSLYPQSYYGGSFEFKVTDKWGIITGANQEFDVLSRKWVTRPFILPIFYSH